MWLLLLACTGGGDDSAPDDSSPPETCVSDTPAVAPSCPDGGGFDNFVTRIGDQLCDGDAPYRFISFNIPNLHALEDPDWHIPDPWEQEDAITSLVQLGGNVARIYTLSVGVIDQEATEPVRHVMAPGELNEPLMVALDHAVAKAREQCVRLIIPLVDQHQYWGGIANYSRFSIEAPAEMESWDDKLTFWEEQFWSDSDVREDYWTTVELLLERTNTVTGVQYKNDPTILAWETGNELDWWIEGEDWTVDQDQEWTTDIAARLKELAPNHLVLDGRYGVQEGGLEDDNIDIVSDHYYCRDEENTDYLANVAPDHQMAQGQKAFLVGEFGFVNPTDMGTMLDAVIDDGMAGALIWSLRFHSVNGGFYWHSEGTGGGPPEEEKWAYHWPGFDSGEPSDETEILELMREKAFAIRGLEVPAIEAPAAPTILSSNEALEFVWQGSAGASSYSLERSANEAGPWVEIKSGFHDAVAENTALVIDDVESPELACYYRMRAHNAGGASDPSAVVGPISKAPPEPPEPVVFTDELDDFTLVGSASSGLYIDTSNPDDYRGDTARASRHGATEESITYSLDNLVTMSAEAYYTTDLSVVHLEFQTSTDGVTFEDLTVSTADDGGDWQRFVYTAESLPEGTNHLRLLWTDTSGRAWSPQLSRVDLEYLE